MNLNANKTCELFELDEGDEIFSFLQEYVRFTFENMEFGFVESSSKVTKCVESFFMKTQGNDKINNYKWWEINTE